MHELRSLFVKLRRLLKSRGFTVDDSDDLIQEAFLRLQVYCQDKTVRQPEAFLVRAALNLAIDEQRRVRGKGIVNEFDIRTVVDPSPPLDQMMAAQVRLRQLRAGLEALSPRAREAFLLHRFDGYSYVQIAERLEISVSMVEKHIAKATLFLMDWMDQE